MATASDVKTGGIPLVAATNVRVIVMGAVIGNREVAQHVVEATLVQSVMKSAQIIVKMPFVFLIVVGIVIYVLNVLPVKMAIMELDVLPNVQATATLDVISTIGIAMYVKKDFMGRPVRHVLSIVTVAAISMAFVTTAFQVTTDFNAHWHVLKSVLDPVRKQMVCA